MPNDVDDKTKMWKRFAVFCSWSCYSNSCGYRCV